MPGVGCVGQDGWMVGVGHVGWWWVYVGKLGVGG